MAIALSNVEVVDPLVSDVEAIVKKRTTHTIRTPP